MVGYFMPIIRNCLHRRESKLVSSTGNRNMRFSAGAAEYFVSKAEIEITSTRPSRQKVNWVIVTETQEAANLYSTEQLLAVESIQPDSACRIAFLRRRRPCADSEARLIARDSSQHSAFRILFFLPLSFESCHHAVLFPAD